MITKELLKFLGDLKKNNNREWFNERKPIFKEHEATAKKFFQEVNDLLSKSDSIESHKVWRIYRDVRFSADKTPFKPRFAGGYKRTKPALRGGYFLHIEPGNTAVGGGFYGPNSADLFRIRKEFEIDDSEIRAIMKKKAFKETFGDMKGEGVKTAPKGFSADHPAIDLIRKKQFYFVKHYSDKEVLHPDFAKEVVKTYKTIRPFLIT